jgi:hypothetical protein
MKRIETLRKEAKAHLDTHIYSPPHKGTKNGVEMMEMARALDSLARAEKILRRAFG